MAKKKGPGKGKGPANRPPSPAKRVTAPKPAAPPSTSATKAPAPTKATPSEPPAPASAKATPAEPPAPPKAAPPKAKGTSQAAQAKGTAAKGPAAKGTAQAKGAAQAKGTAPAASAKAAPAPAKAGTAPAASPKAAPQAKGTPPVKGAAPAKEGRGPSREERLAAAAKARRRRVLRNRALIAGGVAAIVAVVGFVLVSDKRERDQQAAGFQTASCRFDRESDSDNGAGRNHVAAPTYQVDPPAGGNHTPQAAGAGDYTLENKPSDGLIVHALEHGYVVLWYRPDVDGLTLSALRDVAARHSRDVLVVPRPSIPTPVAATAWHARLLCEGIETDTIDRFVTTFANQGPEKIEHP